MQPIPTVFMRWESQYPPSGTMVVRCGSLNVSDEVTPGCEWVLAGEGVATRKWDGTACMVRDGVLYRRLKHDSEKGPPPVGWVHWSGEGDSGHGWVPVGDGPNDHLHRKVDVEGFRDGTYELCGPKIQKNPEGFSSVILVRHDTRQYPELVRTFTDIEDFLSRTNIEGIVFHHPDGRMAKIKQRDFGYRRNPRREVVR